MKLAKRTRGVILCLLFAALSLGSRAHQAEQKLGFLVISVTSGENKAPARGVFVSLRGYRPVFRGESSAVLEPTLDGYFEVALSPGLYDVFVSRGDLLPMCKRVEVVAGQKERYAANLTIDDAHLEK